MKQKQARESLRTCTHVAYIFLTHGTASTRGKIHGNMLQDIQANRGVVTPCITYLSSRNTNKMHSNMGLTVTSSHVQPWCESLVCILNDKIKANTQCHGVLTLTPESLCDGVSSQSLERKSGEEKECRKTDMYCCGVLFNLKNYTEVFAQCHVS